MLSHPHCGGILFTMVCLPDHSGATHIINLQLGCSPRCILRTAMQLLQTLQPSMTASEGSSSRRLRSKL